MRSLKVHVQRDGQLSVFHTPTRSIRKLKWILWTHSETDLAPHTIVGLVLQEGHAEKFPHGSMHTYTRTNAPRAGAHTQTHFSAIVFLNQ